MRSTSDRDDGARGPLLANVCLSWAIAMLGPPALAAEPVEGEWLTGGGQAKIAVAACASAPERLCGTIVWLKRPLARDGQPLRDIANPQPALRSRPVIGLPMLSGFRRAGSDRWTGGKIYDPNDGKTFDAKLRSLPDGTLKVNGCILVFCDEQVWRRPP